jgi:hypothetical protein
MNVFHTKAAFAALFIAALALPASAQNLHIYGGNNVDIDDGSDTPTQLNKTDFGQLAVTGGETFTDFWLFNTDPNVDVTFGVATITGTNATDFVIQQPASPLDTHSFSPLRVTFNPGGAGVRTALVTVPNNTPGSKSSYTFAIQGSGFVTTPVPTADLYPTLGKGTTTKFNKKTNLYTIRWTVPVSNQGPVASESARVRFYLSDDQYFSLTDDPLQSEVIIKGLPAFVEGKKLKTKKAKFKATTPVSQGYIFALVTLLPLDPSELAQGNNLTSDAYFVADN